MLEIDNRYPEYARPYEPIKGRRRHGRLTGNESAFMAQRRMRRLDMTRRGFLTGVGILIVLTVLMPEAKKELILPKVEPVVIEIEKPTPEPKVIPEIKEPEELPIVIPEPKPTPPKPKPDPEPEDEKKAPVVDLDKVVIQPDNEIYTDPTLSFTMKLNDLKGGKAVGRVYVDSGRGFYEPDDSVTVVYDPSSISGDEWSNVEIPVAIEKPADGVGIAGKAKIVFNITYPDGKTAKIETETRPVHAGTFAYFNEAFGSGGWSYGEIDGVHYMKFDVIIDDSLIVNGSQLVPSNVIDNGQYLFYWYGDVSKEHYTEGGVYHIVYTYTSDTDFPAGSYLFFPLLSYKEDDDNFWEPEDPYLKVVIP